MIFLISAMAGVTNYFACRKLLVQRASEILRPEPPAIMGAGALEKTPVWKLFDFATRWNYRDINRNRMRTAAGILGVAACTMLSFTAFGANELQDFNETWEYEELTPAGYTVGFAEDAGYGTVYDYARQYNGQMVENKEGEVFGKNASMLYNISVADEGNLYRFENEQGQFVKLPDNGIAVSYKAADALGIVKDDVISFKFSGEPAVYKVRVKLIYKLYTDMTVPGAYVTERPEVTSVFSKEQFLKSYRKKKESMNADIMYIMVIAVVIGVVVMYNLGIMSFTEKTREIATLKVLGFPTGKIRWILQQQNIFVTGLGTLAGLYAGAKILHFMMIQLDVDSDFMYARMTIGPYIIAFILSFVLSLAVNSIISTKVKDINMVEALKGVE